MPFFVILILIIAGVVGLDQLTKWLIFFKLPINGVAFEIKNFLEITHIRNDGMAFGLLDEHRWIFLTASVIGIAALGVYLFKFSKDIKFTKVGFALIIGGGIGNMIDRIALGEVIDMIHVTVFNDFFPFIFNVADACVCIGVGVAIVGMIYEMVLEYRKKAVEGQSVSTQNSTESVEDNDNNRD